MKSSILGAMAMIVMACAENPRSEGQQQQTTMAQNEALRSTEANTKKFIRTYLSDLNAPDWQTKILNYLPPGSEAFLEEHTLFRESYTNYEATIKHVMVDANECIVWLGITAEYTKRYPLENGSFRDGAIAAFEPRGQELSWEETWYFDVVDGRFGEKWGMLKDFAGILEDLETE